MCISRKPENVQKLQFESVLKSETDFYAKNPQKSSIYTFRSLQRVHFNSFDNFAYNTPLLHTIHLFCKESLHIFIFLHHAAIETKYLLFCRMKITRLINSSNVRSLCFQNWFCKHFYSRFLVCNITIYIWKLFFFFFKVKGLRK